MVVMSFLAGLPSEFETAKSQILSTPEISLLEEVFSRVLDTENSTSAHPNSALVSCTSESGRQPYRSGKIKGKTQVVMIEILVLEDKIQEVLSVTIVIRQDM